MKKKATVIITSNEKVQQKVDLERKNEKVSYREKEGTNVLFDQKEKLFLFQRRIP